MSEPKAPDLNGRARMNWIDAVHAMRQGHIVRRASQIYLRLVEPEREAAPDEDDHEWSTAAVYESGEEGCFLAHAWTVNETPALVFLGASSKAAFVPESDHRNALDWVIVERKDA